MYLDCTIKIPDSNGKITKKTIKGTTYIYYEYARIYLKDKKYNTPRRICIGKQIPGQPALMLPNDKFLKIFPQEILPEEKQGYRSGCLRIGAYIVIRKVISDYRLDLMLARIVGKDAGLFLDLAELSSAQKKDFTALAEALRAELGEDRLLYLMVEAPVWQGAAYNGYDYAALSEPADKLVVRVADYGDVSEDFPIAPLAPLEEVYYALAELADQVDSDCLSLLLTTTGSAWTDGRHTGQASAAEIEQLLSASQTKDYYSDRYACAYTQSGKLTLWYLNGRSLTERQQLLRCFGADSVCLSTGSGTLSLTAE